MWGWISVALLAVVLTLGLLLLLVNVKKKAGGSAAPPNHRLFFFLGAAMLAVGMAELLVFLRSDVSFVVALPLISIGLVFFVIGLANRGKWKK